MGFSSHVELFRVNRDLIIIPLSSLFTDSTFFFDLRQVWLPQLQAKAAVDAWASEASKVAKRAKGDD